MPLIQKEGLLAGTPSILRIRNVLASTQICPRKRYFSGLWAGVKINGRKITCPHCHAELVLAPKFRVGFDRISTGPLGIVGMANASAVFR